MTMQPWLDPSIADNEPGAQYLRVAGSRFGLQPSGLQNSIFGRYIAGQQQPFANTFGFQGRLNPSAAGVQPQSFEQYANWNSTSDMRNTARNLFGQLAGNAAPADVRQQYMQPDEEQATDLRNLAIQALLSRMSPLALRGLRLPSGGDLRDSFVAQTGGQTGGNFIDYLRGQLGLGLI